jgi:nicotinate-nucleotide adenylyltransferase
MRIGVFGGTFDPVHFGHLRLAEACCGQARLDRVEFTPAAQQPHKPRGPVATGEHRAAMLRLAIADEPRFAVSTAELDRGGVSYTVDTLRELKSRFAAAELFFLMGADSLADLPKWREAGAICELAMPLVVRRAGVAQPDYSVLAPLVAPARLAEIRSAQVKMPETPISSSEIQRLIADRGAWRPLVPPTVADYIERHGLYGA